MSTKIIKSRKLPRTPQVEDFYLVTAKESADILRSGDANAIADLMAGLNDGTVQIVDQADPPAATSTASPPAATPQTLLGVEVEGVSYANLPRMDNSERPGTRLTSVGETETFKVALTSEVRTFCRANLPQRLEVLLRDPMSGKSFVAGEFELKASKGGDGTLMYTGGLGGTLNGVDEAGHPFAVVAQASAVYLMVQRFAKQHSKGERVLN